ncbi:hypothetical protein AFI02nite_40630 [Aliivibrio fischeri]|uniref:Uncharacterized protein n=1 Tax=Aliivibrio fischeri TaxID=668 RepID=A0A510UN09_ALIFS|nr:hypothetical protein AFI02nite_40630 [Aliivibrio fischeri]
MKNSEISPVNTTHVTSYRCGYYSAGIPVPDIENVMSFILMGSDEIAIQWNMVAQ